MLSPIRIKILEMWWIRNFIKATFIFTIENVWMWLIRTLIIYQCRKNTDESESNVQSVWCIVMKQFFSNTRDPWWFLCIFFCIFLQIPNKTWLTKIALRFYTNQWKEAGQWKDIEFFSTNQFANRFFLLFLNFVF